MLYRNKIGFHVKSIPDLHRLTQIEGVDLIEVKPDFLRRNGTSLYHFDGMNWNINHCVADEIAMTCEKHGITIQVHLPYEDRIDPKTENGLSAAIRDHHEQLLERYHLMGNLFDQYRIGKVLTVHPPAFRFDGDDFVSEDEAIKVGAEFYAKLDQMMRVEDHKFKIGIENLVTPKVAGTSCVGYRPEHIDRLIGDTSRIGITVDSGHRRLNDLMSIDKLFGYGDVVNVHFHSNDGEVVVDGYDDDMHVLATRENLPHYGRFMKGLRRRALPIVLEISHLEKYTDAELGTYVMNLRRELEPHRFTG